MLSYSVYKNENASKWVTFIHGAGGSSSIWFRQVRAFKSEFNMLRFLIKYDQSSVDDKFIASIISFIYFYFVIFFVLAALLSLTGLDFITAISGAATSISNVGPGLGPIIGPNGDFSSLPDISKWILTIGMILGRLELFAILVLFLPSFWRN